MALTQSLIDKTRRILGDIGTTPSFSDSTLTGYLLDSVSFIERLLPGGYTADYTALTISPNPTGVYQSLFPIQSSIFFYEGQSLNLARRNINVRDGDTAIALGMGSGDIANALKILIEERDKLIAQALANGETAEGDVWTNTHQVIESAPTFHEAMNDQSLASIVVIEP